ncbi:MAG: outer membrane beta-barrel protein [Bacteroidales bacterium]|nr:outer membrane beta-barrel protein [Bacteroidales bacterium]
MKKILISLVALSLVTFSVNAQLKFSASVGYADKTAISKIESGNTVTTESSDMGGFYLGGIASYELMPNVAINGGLQFTLNTESDSEDSFLGEITTKNTAMSLEIPVRASYLLDLGVVGLFAYAGPVFELGLVNKSSFTIGDNTTTSNYYGEDASLNRFDILFGGGLGLTYGQLYLKCGYDYGLLNLSKVDGLKVHNAGLKAGLGVTF